MGQAVRDDGPDLLLRLQGSNPLDDPSRRCEDLRDGLVPAWTHPMEMGSVLEAILAAPGMKDHRPAVVPRALGDSVRVVFQLRPGSSCVERGVLRGAQREVDREAV